MHHKRASRESSERAQQRTRRTAARATTSATHTQNPFEMTSKRVTISSLEVRSAHAHANDCEVYALVGGRERVATSRVRCLDGRACMVAEVSTVSVVLAEGDDLKIEFFMRNRFKRDAPVGSFVVRYAELAKAYTGDWMPFTTSRAPKEKHSSSIFDKQSRRASNADLQPRANFQPELRISYRSQAYQRGATADASASTSDGSALHNAVRDRTR